MGSVSRQGETLTALRSTLGEFFLGSDVTRNHQSRRRITGVTLATVLSSDRKSTSNNTAVQTLFDIIRSEESPSNQQVSKKPWKWLKRRRKSSSTTTRSESLRMDVLGNNVIQRSSSMRLFDALAAERELASVVSEEEPVRMSLMEMLEDSTEHQDEQVEVEEEKEGGGGGGGALMAEMACCVCMVRNKGAAFIPCGHTFCRMCSRELWVKRGNCPLCNNSILEVLDIF